MEQKNKAIQTIEPDFIMVHYDIPAFKQTVRGSLLRLMRKLGFEMWSESVYYGLYSEVLRDEIKRLANFEGVRIKIVSPAFDDNEAEMLRQEYEEKYVSHYTEAKDKLLEVEKMLSDELLYKEKVKGDDGKETVKERPYTGDQIEQRIKTVEVYIRELEHGLGKRVERGELQTKQAESFALRLREMTAYASKLRQSAYKRQQAEAKKTITGAGGNTTP